MKNLLRNCGYTNITAEPLNGGIASILHGPEMSAGDAREGIIRGRASRARLGGKLAGLSLPRQIAVIALALSGTAAELLRHLVGPFHRHQDRGGRPGHHQHLRRHGAVVFLMWFGFVIQGSIMMGSHSHRSRMTGARDYSQAQHGCTRPPCSACSPGSSPAGCSLHAADSWSPTC